MGLKGRLVSEFELKSSADKFHDTVCNNPHNIPSMSEVCHACELHDGEYGKTGSTICWRYILNGQAHSQKQTINVVDEKNKTMVFTAIGGEIMEEFKSFVITLNVISEGNGMDLVRWTIDYEKLADHVLIPTDILGVIVTCSEHIEKHHLKA